MNLRILVLLMAVLMLDCFSLGSKCICYVLRTEGKPTPDFSLPVNNALVTLYWKCDKVDWAHDIFNDMP